MKTKMPQTTFFILLVMFTFSACAPAYIPNVINTPLLSNEKEIQTAVYSGVSGFDPQLSYALTDHVGLMLNGSFSNQSSDTTDDFHKHQFVEWGAGYYTKLGVNGRFEAFGGIGYGNLQTYWENSLWKPYTTVKNIRFFIQPTIGSTTDILDASFSTRVVLIDIYQGSYNSTGIFFEPVLTAKLGYKYVKAVAQLGYSLPLNQSHIDFVNEPIIFSVGLQATIGKKQDK